MHILRQLLVCGALLGAMVWGCTEKRAKVSVPFEENFNQPTLAPHWHARGGQWQVVDGRLFNSGARNVPLWLNLDLPDDFEISFDAESKSPAVDIKFEVCGDGKHHQSGYVVILGGWNNTLNIIARLDEHGPERTDAQTENFKNEAKRNPNQVAQKYQDRRERLVTRDPHKPNTTYRFKLTRKGHTMDWYINDELQLSYFDPSPLRGEGHNRFAFSNWASEVYFDNLQIRAR